MIYGDFQIDLLLRFLIYIMFTVITYSQPDTFLKFERDIL